MGTREAPGRASSVTGLGASPPSGDLSFIEIGCAPGGWMAYFARQFGYRVTGVDYVRSACDKTTENLRLLSVTGKVVNADVFEIPPQG